MSLHSLFVFACIILLPFVFSSIPEFRVLILLNPVSTTPSGPGAEFLFLIKSWKEHLQERLLNVPTWPFNATLEFLNPPFNITSLQRAVRRRINDLSVSPVTIVFIPTTITATVNAVAAICLQNEIPLIATTTPEYSYPRLPIYKTSFFISPPYAYQYIEMVNAFVDKGVKTIISVVMTNGASTFNNENCGFAARFAATRGITLVKEIGLTNKDTNEDFAAVVRSLRDVYQPDAVLWCDITSSIVSPSVTGKLHPISIFKNENYLPKALTFYDALDISVLESLKADGLFLYVIGGSLVSPKAYGSDYTEGNHDYSSMFRPYGSINSIYDQLNFGYTAASPSSTNLFYKWYKEKRGIGPNLYYYALWASFDVMEAGMYRASVNPDCLIDGKISAREMLYSLKYTDITTPNGPVQFDDLGDNIAYNSLVLQSLSTTETADIVYPASARTAEMVYPMPTWDERVYTWKLIKSNYVIIAVIVAAVCSALILAIIITVIVKRREPEIRMLNYSHLVLMCLSGLTVIWSLVFLWQYDTKPRQCSSFMWAIFLPSSFIVQLVNVKAYRLSLFVISTATGRRPKPFSHLKALRITVLLLAISVILLGIIQLADPPKRTLIIYDKYRPKLNEYHCKLGTNGMTLLYIFIVGHVIFSVFCVAAVRNGMEDFRDGMIIKESFLILYLCLAVVFIMSRLKISASVNYLLRSVILSLGITLFIFRFLGNRVLSYWIPEAVNEKLSRLQEIYLKPFMLSLNVSTMSQLSKSHGLSRVDGEDIALDFDAPVYARDIPKDGSILEMINVIKNPKRKKILFDIAKESMNVENVTFLSRVLEFEEDCGKMLSVQSSVTSDRMKETAIDIFNIFVRTNSEEEVNISSSCRNEVDKKLMDWPSHVPIITPEDSGNLIEADFLRRAKVFQTAFHEISIITYQNLWNKFRVAETNALAMSQEEPSVRDKTEVN